MKQQLIILGIVGGFVASGQLYAKCSSNLPYEALTDCIVVEGAGGEYKVPEKYKHLLEDKSTSNESMRKVDLPGDDADIAGKR